MYSALVNTRYVVIDVINLIHPLLSLLFEKLYRHTCLYIILNTSSVYNMTMQLLTHDTSGKYSNLETERGKIKIHVLNSRKSNLGDKKWET